MLLFYLEFDRLSANDFLPFSATGNLAKYLQISYGYHRSSKTSAAKNILKSFGQNFKIFAKIEPLSFVYASRFEIVKSKYSDSGGFLRSVIRLSVQHPSEALDSFKCRCRHFHLLI